jgi:hypothetical protein
VSLYSRERTVVACWGSREFEPKAFSERVFAITVAVYVQAKILLTPMGKGQVKLDRETSFNNFLCTQNHIYTLASITERKPRGTREKRDKRIVVIGFRIVSLNSWVVQEVDEKEEQRGKSGN